MIQLLRKIIIRLEAVVKLFPPKVATNTYSGGRDYFMSKFHDLKRCNPPLVIEANNLSRTLWGIKFRTPLLNAAGMFKNGEAYDLMASIGAGGYIGGTSTWVARNGNLKLDILRPFITLPNSKIAVNFLGLPNVGDRLLSSKIFSKNKLDGCPIGWSVMRSPGLELNEGMEYLIKSLFLFEANLLIDFIEINESCPNVGADFSDFEQRLSYIANNFLVHRKRNLPVVVKLSNDLTPEKLKQVLLLLTKYGFDGLNIGNTSTNYAQALAYIDKSEKNLYSWFTSNIGGGISGAYLKENSLQLCKMAVDYVTELKPNHEFHIIRTGGIDCYDDILQSEAAGISLNQWYTGFFSNYLRDGNKIYQNFFQ
jgi:dihydroorotate dehydrogenase